MFQRWVDSTEPYLDIRSWKAKEALEISFKVGWVRLGMNRQSVNKTITVEVRLIDKVEGIFLGTLKAFRLQSLLTGLVAGRAELG